MKIFTLLVFCFLFILTSIFFQNNAEAASCPATHPNPITVSGTTGYCFRSKPASGCADNERETLNKKGEEVCYILASLDGPKLPSATDTRSELDLKNSGFTAQNLPTIIISKVFPVVLVFAGFLAVVFIVISGIQFISSNGDPKGAEAARTKLTFAIIGFIIVILAFLITQIIDRIFLNSGAI